VSPFGAILAGGQSVRYGAPKALAEVGGRRIIDRVVDTLGRVCDDLVLLANDPTLFADLGLPTRPDARPGLGALGGIQTALAWAGDAGRPGIVAVACDMPFLSAPLLTRLRDLAFEAPAGFDLVVPESRGRRGVEPLCAAYGTGCLAAIEAELDRGESHVIGFYDDVRVRRLPLAEVESLCDPGRAFLNVNTPEERDRAEGLARDSHAG
jgi:molybdopterin-guanine dinucleotide biosynthesis protein